MKKIILLIFIAFAVGQSSFSQSVKFSLDAGLNISRFNEPGTVVNGPTLQQTTSSGITGFHAGVLADFDIQQISLQPGLFYTTKGSNFTGFIVSNTPSGTTSSKIVEKETLNYLEIPVNVLYNIPLHKIGKLFIGGGPYAAVGVSGKTNYTGTYVYSGTTTVISGDGTVKFGATGVKTVDYGINTFAGIAFTNKISLSAGYGFGLANLSNGGYASKNHVLSFSVSYWFL